MDHYQCTRCKLLKESAKFHKNSSKPSGLASMCKTCTKDYHREYSQRPERKAAIATRAKANPEAGRQRQAAYALRQRIQRENRQASRAASPLFLLPRV